MFATRLTGRVKIDDHFQLKTRIRNKKRRNLSEAATPANSSTSGARSEFIKCFVAVCAESDISLETTEKQKWEKNKLISSAIGKSAQIVSV